MLTTPSGTPASRRISTSASIESGVWWAGLMTTGAAGGDGRRDLAGAHRHREVPRRDEQARPDGLARDQEAGAAGRGGLVAAGDAHRLAGEVAEELRGVRDLAARLGHAACPSRGSSAGRGRRCVRAAARRRAVRMSARACGRRRGERRLRRHRGVERRDAVGRGRVRDRAQHPAGGRVEHVEGLLRPRRRPTCRRCAAACGPLRRPRPRAVDDPSPSSLSRLPEAPCRTVLTLYSDCRQYAMEVSWPSLSEILKQATGVIAARGEGVLLFDEDDRRYLDFTAGIGVTSTGHSHPRVVEAAQQQVAKADPRAVHDRHAPAAADPGRPDRRGAARRAWTGCTSPTPARRPSRPRCAWPAWRPAARTSSPSTAASTAGPWRPRR